MIFPIFFCWDFTRIPVYFMCKFVLKSKPEEFKGDCLGKKSQQSIHRKKRSIYIYLNEKQLNIYKFG